MWRGWKEKTGSWIKIEFLPPNIFKPFDVKLGPRGVDMNGLVLSLSGNLLERIPALTLPRLTHLGLSRNRLTHIDPDALNALPFLEVLDLSHNLIKSLDKPHQLPSTHLNESHLFFGSHLKKLEWADLSGNQILSFPSLKLIFTHLKFLNLSGNKIPGFISECPGEDKDLDEDSALETLDLSNNSFRLKPFYMQCAWERAMVINVKHLNLSWNGMNFSYCEEKMERKRKVYGCMSFFTEMEALEVIILSHNYINFIPMEFQHYLPRLRFVDLSHNRIKRLWHHDFLITNGVTEDDLDAFALDGHHFVKRTSVSGDIYYEYPNSHHLIIDLSYNNITSIVLPDEKTRTVPQDCDVETQFARATIRLGGNPFRCGCEVFRLLRYSLQEIRPISEREDSEGHRLALPAAINIQGLTCSSPESVRGKAVSEPETWAYHLLPLMGLCSYQKGMQQL
ncbi:extracellular matrix protein 2-like isoform X2 [Ischnura elegans]|uniref:extracellular matrix protein 2-like isoform X2 n=1 Tax=Ischnura elegans TaxID=197161 RepID=UPI001ED86797|nr:extracellular matrix protein 2-like isoform X2 [Ischnura elegans]